MRWVLIVTLWLAAGTALADGRYALVIGNSDYQTAGRLPNPARDASAVADAFERLGYTVSLYTDADRQQMSEALRDFRRLSRDAQQAVIYFAGHGLAPTGTSFVLPVDAQLATPEDLTFEAVSVDELTAAVAHASEIGLVILDACRDNPLVGTMAQANPTRSISRGLARAQPRGGTLIAYAAEAGDTAADGDGDHSPYTEALLASLDEPGLEVGFLFRKVRDRVLEATGGVQRPDHYSALPAREIFLNPPQPGAAGQAVAAAVPPPAQPQTDAFSPAPGVTAADLELTLWQAVQAEDSAAAYRDYLARYPEGTFASLAQRRIERLTGESTALAGTPAAQPADQQPGTGQTAQPQQAAPLTSMFPSIASALQPGTVYRQPAPTWQQPAPSYQQQPAPTYQQPAPTYQQPAPAYAPPQQAAPAAPQPSSSRSTQGMIFPDSASRLLTAQELRGLSSQQLRIARNEIFARRGRYFDSADLKAYFGATGWYSPFTWDVRLTDIEKRNADLIKAEEARR